MAMTAVWVRAAVTAVALSGDDPTALLAVLDAGGADAARGHRARLRGEGERVRIASSIAREAAALRRLHAVPRSPDRGARLLARWMRGLAPATRADAARALDASDAEAVRRCVPAATPLPEHLAATAGFILARSLQREGRVLRPSQWTELLDAAEGRAVLADADTRAIDRVLRLLGRASELVALAAEVP
jgi:hypothetical protein